MSVQLQWGAFCRTGFTSWRVFPECKGDLRQTSCSLWEVKFKTSLGRNEDAFAQELVKEWTVTASLSLSPPSWWQMSSPVGGYLHRKIVQQTSCQKPNRCLWISNIKFKSFSTTELSTEKNGLSFTWCFPDPRISSSRQLKHLVNGSDMLAEERGWAVVPTRNPESESSEGWCKRGK